MAHHIFPKAEMTSNNPLHNKRYHFVVYFLTPFPSDKIILFAVKDVMSHNNYIKITASGFSIILSLVFMIRRSIGLPSLHTKVLLTSRAALLTPWNTECPTGMISLAGKTNPCRPPIRSGSSRRKTHLIPNSPGIL